MKRLIHTYTVPENLRIAYKDSTEEDCPTQIGFVELTVGESIQAAEMIDQEDFKMALAAASIRSIDGQPEPFLGPRSKRVCQQAGHRLANLLQRAYAKHNMLDEEEAKSFFKNVTPSFMDIP